MGKEKQGIGLFTAILAMVGVNVVIQLWLLSAALDALLGGEYAVLVPSLAASLFLFLINAGLIGYVFAFDARLRKAQ